MKCILMLCALLAPATLSRAADQYTGLEVNGDASTVRDGRLVVFTYSTGHFNVEYVTETIFADGFEP